MDRKPAALFAALVDDAGLYPPEELAMVAALARYRRDRAAGSVVLSGRFLCAVDRLTELGAALRPDDRVTVGVIAALDPATVAAAVAAVNADARLVLGAVEGVASAGLPAAVEALANLPVPCFVEVPVTVDDAMLRTLAQAGVGAKVRCGGLRAELFPAPEDLGRFLSATVRAGLTVKATAGLHHAVRHTDPRTGFTHHGFLNLVLGVARAVQDLDPVDALVETVPAELVTQARGLPAAVVVATRAVFMSYGSCSTSEPLEDLDVLGLISTGGRV